MLLVALGDSISATRDGWTTQLAERFGADLLTLAIPGSEAHDAIADQLPRLPYAADIASIYFGSNDVRRAWDPLRFERSLSRLIRDVTDACPVILMPTVPLTIRPWPPTALARARTANAIIRRLARSTGAVVVNMDRVPLTRYWTSDLVHPKPAGHRLLADRALAALQPRPPTNTR